MPTPILLICGGAGSGKDTVASMIAEHIPTVCIAQADPMKRFAADVFGFTEQQLWGPSEERNKPAEQYTGRHAWEVASHKLMGIAATLTERVLPGASEIERGRAVRALLQWFDNMQAAHFLTNSALPDKILTPRYMLQTVGTEWGRKVAPNMWNDLAVSDALKILGGGYTYSRAWGLTQTNAEVAQPHQTLRVEMEGPQLAVITDGRFRNEVLGVKRAGGAALLVVNPTDAGEVQGGVAGHRSEQELKGVPRFWFDYTLNNNKAKGLDFLRESVERFVETIF